MTLLVEASEEIRRIMSQRGITRAKLAKRIGCSRPHISMVLSGSRNLTLKTLSEIAQALNCKVKVTLEDSK